MDSLKITKKSIFDLVLRLCERSRASLVISCYEDEFELSNCCYKDDIELSNF